MPQAPNFLTCPAAPELPPPSGKKTRPPADPSISPAQTPPAEPIAHRRSRRFFLIKKTVILLVVIGLLVISVPPAIALGRAGWAAREAKLALDSLQYRLQIGDYATAADEAGRAKQALDDFGQALQGVGFFRDAPFVGTQVKALQDTAMVGYHTLDSLQDLLSVAAALEDALIRSETAMGQAASAGSGTQATWQQLAPSEKRALLASLQESLPEIRLARDKIDMALALWDAVPKDRMMPALLAALDPLAKILPVMRQAMDQSVPLLETLIPLGGYPDPKTYLVILQNSDEMRPAGGFIGSVAKVTLDAGEVKDFQFFDVYNIDNPVSAVWHEVPPEPLAKNLGVKAWFMRDANWSPDFAVSADKILDFYTRETALQGKDEHVDGVIAFEPGFFRELLRKTGPIQVAGQNYDDKNFMDLLEYQVEVGFLQQGAKVEERKDVMGQLGTAILQKLQAMPRSSWPDLLDLLTTALHEKQIMVYSHDASLQAMLDERDWSGRTKPTTCDFLWVVDANLAALKTDGKMVKRASYELDAADPSKPTAKVTLTYQNTTQQITWRYTRYRSYTRVYVPEGSQLISSTGAMQGDLSQTGGRFVPGKVDVMHDLGKTVFGAFWSVEPGKTGTLSFTYALPSGAADCLSQGKYVMDWPKQPGADDTELDFKATFPRSITAADPPEEKAKWGDNVYEVIYDSLVDRHFQVQF